MFNRQLSVQLVKTPKPRADGTIVACDHPSAEQIEEIVRRGVMDAAQLVAFAYVGKKVVDTVCKVAVITAKAKLK